MPTEAIAFIANWTCVATQAQCREKELRIVGPMRGEASAPKNEHWS